MKELTNTELIQLLTALAAIIDANNNNTAGDKSFKITAINSANWIADKVMDQFRFLK